MGTKGDDMIDRDTRKSILASGTALFALMIAATPALAQTLPAAPPAAEDSSDAQIIVTGSRIKRDPNDSSLPLQIITTQELGREGISNPEQLIAFLSTNGNGADNLASNSDVVGASARGKNGLSAANLRGQGSSSTLVLLNGRRVAAHGLQGSAVDVNQIPFAAIERVEVLKDGASAIYGTDAIGGVINFITKKNFTGLSLQGFTDITEQGDSPIYRLSATAGYGKLDEQGFNIMAAVSKSWNGSLIGSQRDFVNGNQPNRGLSIDTRGVPIATAFALNPTTGLVGITQGGLNAFTGTVVGAGTLLGGRPGTATSLATNPGFFIPGTTTAAVDGVNPLRLPGGAGCTSIAGGMNYDSVLWATPTAALACAWDTSSAATLQQPLETLTYYGRATARIGGRHEIFAEVTGSKAISEKIFSYNQYTGNNTTLPIAYPLNALTVTNYNQIFDSIARVLPAIGTPGNYVTTNGNYGRPIAFRFRCVACGPRSYVTDTRTLRATIGAEGPLFAGWDYRAGASYASSQADSTLGTGFHYRGTFNGAAAAAASGVPGAASGRADPRAPTAPGASAPGIVGLFNSGILNPFSVSQSPEALAGLRAVSAEGVTLYGGKYEVRQFDASISGGLFRLPGGMIKVALGVDYRKESYSLAANVAQVDIFNAAFDPGFALGKVTRDVKAAYAEVLFPVFDRLEITAAGRIDDYSGFGSTFNPKVTVKFRPVDWLLFRGSYNTGFRVPTFNQIFNGTQQSANPGNTLVDPTRCPTGVVSATPGCAAITPDSLIGGNVGLGPETSKQFSLGAVFQPSRNFSFSVDYWNIAVDNTISSDISITDLFANLASFPERITRDAAGNIVLIDQRAGNFGSRRTEGIEFSARGNFDALGGQIGAGFEGTYLLVKRDKLLPNLPYINRVGVYSLDGDIGLRWKHNAFISYARDGFGITLSQIYRSGYKNRDPYNGVVRPDYNPRVKAYVLYNASVSQQITERFTIGAGVRNIFNRQPPFALTYDSDSGSGGSWEPRVADPRGRSFTMNVEVKF
jgi:iron complex outermembrane recepter protein